MVDKIIKFDDLEESVKKIKQKSETIILVGGCFDVLHEGHLRFLKNAKNLNGKLIVALEPDHSITKLKGKERPINSQISRAKILSNLPETDIIILLPQLSGFYDYFRLVQKIKPDIIAITKGDPRKSEKEQQVKENGGEVVEVINRIKKYSTTKSIKKNKL